MAKTLDSSEVFFQDNYQGRIREIVINGEPHFRGDLSSVLKDAEEIGYIPCDLTIVNRVLGNPRENVPTESIIVRNKHEEKDALIIKENEGIYGFYKNYEFIQ